jgi:hypothetical protein
MCQPRNFSGNLFAAMLQKGVTSTREATVEWFIFLPFVFFFIMILSAQKQPVGERTSKQAAQSIAILVVLGGGGLVALLLFMALMKTSAPQLIAPPAMRAVPELPPPLKFDEKGRAIAPELPVVKAPVPVAVPMPQVASVQTNSRLILILAAGIPLTVLFFGWLYRATQPPRDTKLGFRHIVLGVLMFSALATLPAILLFLASQEVDPADRVQFNRNYGWLVMWGPMVAVPIMLGLFQGLNRVARRRREMGLQRDASMNFRAYVALWWLAMGLIGTMILGFVALQEHRVAMRLNAAGAPILRRQFWEMLIGWLVFSVVVGVVLCLWANRGSKQSSALSRVSPSQPSGPGYRIIVGLWLFSAVAFVLPFLVRVSQHPEEFWGNGSSPPLVFVLAFWVFLVAGLPTLIRYFWINRLRIRHAIQFANEVASPTPSPEQPKREPILATAPPHAPRACPKCSAPLTADAPQGMCPKCLMAGAFRSVLDSNRTSAYRGSDIPPTLEEVQEFFPNLDILGLIGHGGMGAVYQARQPNLDRIVALKLIRPREDNPAFAERFVREAKAMAKLNHSNIVTIYESGEAGGSLYLIMEYIDGITLREAIRAKAIPPSEAMKIVGQLCDALDYAHSQGVVHRDIKPENILLDRTGKVRVVDFGLAKLSDEAFTLTHTRQAMGTPHYMAPEQWEKPTEVDHRADIYALGVVIYELLTGELPLGRFDPPSVKARLDARIDEIVLRLLSKEPDKRYQQASEVRTAIGRLGEIGTPKPGFYEYKSERTLWGLPLVHIVRGVDPRTGKKPWAKGIVAIGQKAMGVVALGQFAVGVFALGQFAVGLFVLAQFGIAPFVAIGQFAISLVFSVGMLSTGFFTIGMYSLGYFVIAISGWGWKRLTTSQSDPDFGEHFREMFGEWWQ